MWLVLCDYPVRDRIQLFISTGQCGGVSWKDVVLKFKTEIYKYICGKKKKKPRKSRNRSKNAIQFTWKGNTVYNSMSGVKTTKYLRKIDSLIATNCEDIEICIYK